ncbi:6080_t:CDS:2 [Ambispora gerdemannii]|uniref:6080_t:CDS:1 n=1 Tax=Ambispora gerdemannii TaxID=144530 RepID=A0A9N9G008_9GLOM|nr:6080_t:CDS:2 [Ambispora gerdemannii]
MDLNTTDTTLKYCDWRVEIYNCHHTQLWVAEIIFSTISYGILAISGAFIFYCRVRYMWQGLFVDHGGTGIRPLPVDCLLLFFMIAAFVRAIHSAFLLGDVYTAYWQRELGEEFAWTILSYGAVTYLIGIIYTIPVNYTRGTSALVSLQTNRETTNGDANKSSTPNALSFTTHELFLPTPNQLNICLLVGCLWPSLIALPSAILSGLARDRGDFVTASKFTTVQYSANFVFDIVFAVITAYYGLNFILILRGTLKQSKQKSGASFFKKNSSQTRKAFHRLKYTMAYLFYISSYSGPWWLVWAIAHKKIIASINGINVYLSIMWYIAGPQLMIVVCQFVLARRIYQQLFSRTDNGHRTVATNGANGPVSPKSPDSVFFMNPSSAAANHLAQ